jgi:serine beta-lactamase-like protein LACTB, mitochondrial
MMRRMALFIVSMMLLSQVQAQAQERFDPVARISEEVRKELGAPGLSVAVALNDELVWSSGFGMADVENDVPSRGNTVYRIASISKTFGATSVLQLVDHGLVSVDDPIEKYVPTFHHSVTLRQIMTHTSGIRHYKPGESLSMTRFNSLADAIRIFKDDPLMFDPGTKVLYSSYAFNLLQGVVETASGMSLESYLKERIFEPAGLKETYLEYAERIVPHRAHGYVRKGDLLQNAPYVDNSIKWFGGGLISSAEDLIRFNIALNKGELLLPASLHLMNTAGSLKDGTAIDYSLGWELATDAAGNHYVDKYGSGTGVSTYVLRIPEKHFAVAVLVNISHGNIKEYARKIADTALKLR